MIAPPYDQPLSTGWSKPSVVMTAWTSSAQSFESPYMSRGLSDNPCPRISIAIRWKSAARSECSCLFHARRPVSQSVSQQHRIAEQRQADTPRRALFSDCRPSSTYRLDKRPAQTLVRAQCASLGLDVGAFRDFRHVHRDT